MHRLKSHLINITNPTPSTLQNEYRKCRETPELPNGTPRRYNTTSADSDSLSRVSMTPVDSYGGGTMGDQLNVNMVCVCVCVCVCVQPPPNVQSQRRISVGSLLDPTQRSAMSSTSHITSNMHRSGSTLSNIASNAALTLTNANGVDFELTSAQSSNDGSPSSMRSNGSATMAVHRKASSMDASETLVDRSKEVTSLSAANSSVVLNNNGDG
jgi:hypothetical protein